MMRIGHSLEKIVESTTHLKQVRKADLQYGDLLLITTRNSVYSVRVLDNNLYLVSGGWFDHKGLCRPWKLELTAVRGAAAALI